MSAAKKKPAQPAMKPTAKGKNKPQYDVIRPRTTKKVLPVTPATPVRPAPIPPKQRAKLGVIKLFKKFFGSIVFGRLYAVVAVVVLTVTTLVWGILGAQQHMSNADQLADPYLFASGHALKGATFPGDHSLLLKWPLFWLVQRLHYSTAAFIGVTLASVLLTLAVLVYVMYRIERRPAVFGTLCLALASVLLLVPASPYAGALLPVNMAMLATRNLEYALYIVSLVLLIRSPRVRSVWFWLGVLLLGLLIASDKLFLGLSLAAGLGALLLYGLRQHHRLVKFASHWLLAGMLAAALAIGGLAVINARSWTTVAGGGGASPYTTTQGLRGLGLGVIYGGLDLLTNFGANPAYDATQLKAIPQQTATRLVSEAGPAYLVNALILLIGIVVVLTLLIKSLHPRQAAEAGPDTAGTLALALIFSSLVVIALFVLTNHYYAVDARYLTIAVFAVFVAAAEYSRQYTWRRNYLVLAGLLMTGAIFLAIPQAINSYADNVDALDDVQQRNVSVVQALKQHPVKGLVGDYWRVLPIKRQAAHQLPIMALSDCTQPREVLLTKSGQPDLQKQSFAYLLSFDKSLTDFPRCNLQQVSKIYGRPDASILIAGSFTQPKEELLFYDHGMHPGNQTGSQAISSVVPIPPTDIPAPTCSGPTVMTVVAHQDDDLLFTSPDLLHDIQAGHCMRTIYITAGDAGYDQYYWLSRQQGSENAYDNMIGRHQGWMQRIVKIGDKQFITVANPFGNSKISLIFMNLPDGNLTGEGFAASHFQSLDKLEQGRIKQIEAVDHQSHYTGQQLGQALATLMRVYQPSEVHTQATVNESDEFPDHSDHLAVGRLTEQAYNQYIAGIDPTDDVPPIFYYIGYPIHAFDPNVSDLDLAEKEAAFLAYAKYDGSVCHTIEECIQTPTYEAYLSRQYQQQPGQ